MTPDPCRFGSDRLGLTHLGLLSVGTGAELAVRWLGALSAAHLDSGWQIMANGLLLLTPRARQTSLINHSSQPSSE